MLEKKVRYIPSPWELLDCNNKFTSHYEQSSNLVSPLSKLSTNNPLSIGQFSSINLTQSNKNVHTSHTSNSSRQIDSQFQSSYVTQTQTHVDCHPSLCSTLYSPNLACSNLDLLSTPELIDLNSPNYDHGSRSEVISNDTTIKSNSFSSLQSSRSPIFVNSISNEMGKLSNSVMNRDIYNNFNSIIYSNKSPLQIDEVNVIEINDEVEEEHEREYDVESYWETEVLATGQTTESKKNQVESPAWSEEGTKSWLEFESKSITEKMKHLEAKEDGVNSINYKLLQSKLHRLNAHPYLRKTTRMPHRNRKNINGDLAYVEYSESTLDCKFPLPPLIYQLSSQEETCTRTAYESFLRVCTHTAIPCWIRTGPGDSKQARLREWLLFPDKRTLLPNATNEEITTINGFLGLESILLPRMTQGITKNPSSVVLHLKYSSDNVIESSNVKESNIQIIFSFAKSCAGGGKIRTNYCTRLTTVISKSLLKLPKTKLGELQFFSRLIEDKCWILFEDTNDSAERIKPDLSLTPLYLTFARDEIAFNLIPLDEIVHHNNFSYIRREWFFEKANVPILYNSKFKFKPFTKDKAKRKSLGPAVGVTQYFDLFTDAEQQIIDDNIINLDQSFEIILLRELTKTISWPECFNFLDIDFVCDNQIIPLRIKTPEEVKLEAEKKEATKSVPVEIIDLSNLDETSPDEKKKEKDTRSRELEKKTSKKRSRSKSHSSKKHHSKKHKKSSHCQIHCSRIHFVKVFQNFSTFIELYERGNVQVKNYSDPKGLLTFLDSLCSTIQEQAFLTCHRTLTEGQIHRTKFFFELSYLWTEKQIQERGACWAAFTRASVPQPPWISDLVEQRLIDTGIVNPGFLTSSAINIYHTGNTGLLPHFDDSVRFTPPIFSYQPFTGKRLTFGTLTTRMTNSLMMIPLPRGCITVLEKKSFACDAVKHCVRPQDMNGMSGALIMRNIPVEIMTKARQYNPVLAQLECDHKFHLNSGKTVKVSVKNAAET